MLGDLTGARRLLSVKEAAEALNIAHSTAKDLIKSGHLDGRKVGRRILVPDIAIPACIANLPSAKKVG